MERQLRFMTKNNLSKRALNIAFGIILCLIVFVISRLVLHSYLTSLIYDNFLREVQIGVFTSEPKISQNENFLFAILMTLLFAATLIIWIREPLRLKIISLCVNMIVVLIAIVVRGIVLSYELSNVTEMLDYELSHIGLSRVLLATVTVIIPINYVVKNRLRNFSSLST